MEYSVLGKTGLKVSRIGYGGSGLGNMYSDVDAEEGEACLLEAVYEYGINFIDMDPTYGHGSLAERRLGEMIRKHPDLRSKIILATKCGTYFADDEKSSFFPDGILKRCFVSFRRS